MQKVKILIVDELPIIAHAFKELLLQQPDIECIEEVSAFGDVLEKVKDHNYDILITDIVFENKLVTTELQQLRNCLPDIRILIVTQYIAIDLYDKLIKIGIEGFVLKDEKIEKFVWVVNTIIQGNCYYSDRLNEPLYTSTYKRSKLSQIYKIELTLREYEVLNLIAQEYTTNDIAKMLFISTNTVETHRKHLITKFETKNMVGLIKKACQHGLIDYLGLQLLFFVQMTDVI